MYIHMYYRSCFKGKNLSETADYDGRAVLHLAAREGHYELGKFLLEHVEVDQQPEDR